MARTGKRVKDGAIDNADIAVSERHRNCGSAGGGAGDVGDSLLRGLVDHERRFRH
jgi:hypothetical protein